MAVTAQHGEAQDLNRRLRRDRRREKLASIVVNELILDGLEAFLERHYRRNGSGSVLDLGAGTKPYAPVYERYFSECTSVDVARSPHDISKVDVIATADELPFSDGSFDCVICTEVLEHCADPAAVLREVHRALKPGGRAFLTTPFMIPLHEMPYDYYRYTPSALRELSTSQGFIVTSLEPKGEYVAVVLRALLMPWTKLWQQLARRTGIDLYHPRNPLVYLTIVAPQRLYVALWRATGARRGRIARLLRGRLTYYTLGYVTELERPA
jgi:SAM-dependent methyltransferase